MRAIAGFTIAANRGSGGNGTVALGVEEGVRSVRMTFTGSEPAGEAKPVAADCGFGFFRSRLFVIAMGSAVECDRRERYLSLAVTLPR
ncbi:MAG: hypothetical protein U0547_01770 [Dehalococcoidia bacterium]